MRWTRIDDLVRADHMHLQPGDECFCFCEFKAGDQWYGPVSQQYIYNLKKPMTQKGLRDWKYKGQAIDACAEVLGRDMGKLMQQPGAVFVPVPPSKTKGHAEYDDRMLQVLRKASAKEKLNADIRELVCQRKDMQASHLGGSRNIRELIQNYEINQSCTEPPPKIAIIVDDLVTTGAHFKAMQSVLIAEFGQIKTLGLFMGRCI